MAKRSRASRFGMLALSFALVFSLTSPTWLFAAELVMPESDSGAPIVIEDQAPVVVQDPLEEAPAPDDGKSTLDMGKPDVEETAMVGGPNVNGSTTTWAYSSSEGDILCPGTEVTVEMQGYYDGQHDRDRGLRIALPDGVENVNLVSAQVWKDPVWVNWGWGWWIPGEWQNVASSLGSADHDDSDLDWYQVTTNGDVDKDKEEFRVVITFDMPCEDVVEASVESGSRYGLWPYNWFWGDAVSLDTIYVAEAGLSVWKSVENADDPLREIQQGSTVLVTVDVENTGNVDLEDVALSDALPTGFEYVADSAELDGSPFMLDATTSPGYVLGEIELLEDGDVATLTYLALVVDAEPGHYDPVVSVSADNPCCEEQNGVYDRAVVVDNNGCCESVVSASTAACVNVLAPNLQVGKTVTPNSGIEPGDVLDIEITIENVCDLLEPKGDNSAQGFSGYVGTAYNVVVNDTIPAGFTYVPNSAMISINGADPVPATPPTMWALGDLAPCDIIVITYKVLAGDDVESGTTYGAGVSVSVDGQDSITAEAEVETADFEDDEVLQTGYNDWLWIGMVLALLSGAVVAGRLSLRA